MPKQIYHEVILFVRRTKAATPFNKSTRRLNITSGLNNPKGSSGTLVTSRVFSERKNLGKSCKDFLFKPC